jgi:hypothetical protein
VTSGAGGPCFRLDPQMRVRVAHPFAFFAKGWEMIKPMASNVQESSGTASSTSTLRLRGIGIAVRTSPYW